MEGYHGESTRSSIQRQSHDSAAVTRLARAQERELRSWLYAVARNECLRILRAGKGTLCLQRRGCG